MGTKISSTLLLLALTACGAPRATESTTNDVATDLDGAGVTANVRLYYQIGVEIHEGRCTPGLPALRTNCQAGIRKVQAAAFATELQLLTSAAVKTAMTARNSRQAQYDEALEILTTFDDLTARKGNAEAAIKLLQTELAAAKTQATALLGQISAIEESLLANPSPSLQAQRDQLKGELKSVQQKQAATSQKLGVENSTLADVVDELSNYDERPELVLALANAQSMLTAAKASLAAAEKDQALAVDSLDKIKEEGLTYDILSGTDDFAKNRAHVQKFKAIFDKLLLPPPPPPPAALTGTFGGAVNVAFSVADQRHKIEVPTAGKIGKVSITLQVDLPTKSDFDDLTIYVERPDGTSILLQQNANGSSLLEARANMQITFALATGIATPALASFAGGEAKGTWNLRFVDDDSVDSGVLKHALLKFEP